jgi:3-(3-hydroxy-phenyl)propionate hydroxylase/6-hydroxy-3-succinoylpyridine 3-monooxygenase
VDSSNVVVAGGGPVGLVIALGLAKAGIEVTVIEKKPAVGSSPRAMAYLYAVLDGFEKLGVLGEFEREGIAVDRMTFIDYATGERIPHTFTPLAGYVRHPYTLHLGQDQVSRILMREIARYPNARVRYGAELTDLNQDDRGVTARVKTTEGESALRAAWLVGADGASSAVRSSLGLGFDGFTWPDRFVATNIKFPFEQHDHGYANFQIDPVYGAIIAKINKAGLWRYTYREPGELPVQTLNQRITEHLAKALPGDAAYQLVQFSPYRIHQRAAETFRTGRVLLAGDAAHITNPAGGLGLVGGFLDALVLHEALAAVIHGRADEAVLDAYAAERRRVFTEVVSPMATENKKRMFDPPPGDARAQMIEGLRFLAVNDDARRDQLLGLRSVVTPSLLGQPGGAR